MSNQNIENNRAIVKQAVKKGIKAYADSRRRNITPFIEDHFSFNGAWELNKCAFGKDLLRAPANLLWAPVYFAAKLGSAAAEKAGMESVSENLNKVGPGFRTDVEREVEWLMYSEFLELPFVEGDRTCEKNALLTFILADDAMVSLFEEKLLPFACIANDPHERAKLEDKLGTYVNNRKDVAELTTTIMGISAGLAAHKGINLGTIGLGQVAAATIAQQIAISNFFLGQSIGGIYYSFFPASASMGLLRILSHFI